MARESFLPLFVPDDTGIQREDEPDHRHRDRGAEKVIPDFLDMRTNAAEFQDPRCGLTAFITEMFPATLFSSGRTIAMTYPAVIGYRFFREKRVGS